MATNPQPMIDQQAQGAGPQPGAGAPPQGGSDQGGAATPPPSQAPANPLQMLLARWYQTVKQMAQSDPRLASGAEKVSQGIQEMQTALVAPAQPTPTAQQPQY